MDLGENMVKKNGKVERVVNDGRGESFNAVDLKFWNRTGR